MKDIFSFNINKFISSHLKYIHNYYHGGLTNYYKKKYHLKKINDYSINLNPLGGVFKYKPFNYYNIFNDSLKHISQYSDINYNKLKYSICKYLNKRDISKQNIILGNGSTEIISLFCHCFLNKFDIVIIISPTFSEYEHFCKVQNAKIIYINEKDILKIDENILKLAKIIFLCNPNNPTGYYYQENDLIYFIKKCLLFQTFVFIDEAFIELTNYYYQTICKYVSQFENIFVLRSLTKSFSIPGVRFGYGISNKKIIKLLEKVKIPWNIGCFNEALILSILSLDKNIIRDYFKKSNKLISNEKKYLIKSLLKIKGLKPIKSETCYLLIKIDNCMKIKSNELKDKLLKKGILVRNCDNFRSCSNSIRICIKNHYENKILIKKIREVIHEKKNN